MMRFNAALDRVLEKKKVFLVVLLLLCSSYATKAVTFLPFKGFYRFEEKPTSSSLMLNKEKGWTPSNTNIINGAFSKQHFWIKIDIDSLKQNAIIIVENAHIDTLDVYAYDRYGHLLNQYHSGDMTLFTSRYIPYHYFNFYIPKATTQVLIHSRSQGSLLHPLKIISAEEPSYFLHDNSVHLIFFGVLLLALVINLMFSAFLKDSIYLYYSLYLIGMGISYANDMELLFQYLWPAHPEINHYNSLIYSLTFLMFFFSEKFLQLKHNHKTLHFIYQVLYGLFILTGALSLFSYPASIIGVSILLMLGPILVIVSAVVVYVRKKETQTLIFLLAWSLYMLAMLTYSLSVASVIPYFSGQEKLLIVGTTMEIITLMVAVVYKFNIIREEGMKTKERLINALYENEKMLSNQNIVLEERIKARTIELEEKNVKLRLQSELLEDQNKIIESSNRLLKDNQAYLEQLVQERTEELTQTNKELLKRNDRLEQFSFVAAHNIRGPLSTMLGLANLYYLEKARNTSPDHEFYLKKIKESGEKLDTVVHSLNHILDLESPEVGENQMIELESIMKEIASSNELLFKENQVQITTDFSAQPELWTIPLLFTSIMNQLIGNSIKYKKHKTAPQITIRSSVVQDRVNIEFIDNSEGIDMNRFKENVFQPFKRLNANDSGAGIGLYIVKRQMEAMNGTIELESGIGKGCKYTMSFPPKPK